MSAHELTLSTGILGQPGRQQSDSHGGDDFTSWGQLRGDPVHVEVRRQGQADHQPCRRQRRSQREDHP